MNTQTKMGLTPKQAHLKNLIKIFIDENGHSPSYREMMELSKLTSTSAVHRLLQCLEQRGHIHLLPGQERSVTVID